MVFGIYLLNKPCKIAYFNSIKNKKVEHNMTCTLLSINIIYNLILLHLNIADNFCLIFELGKTFLQLLDIGFL